MPRGEDAYDSEDADRDTVGGDRDGEWKRVKRQHKVNKAKKKDFEDRFERTDKRGFGKKGKEHSKKQKKRKLKDGVREEVGRRRKSDKRRRVQSPRSM